MSKGVAINTFTEGLVSDLNAITTPNSVLTDVKNGTVLTFNGNELVLQNDMGNTDLTDAITGKVQLSEGFKPIGVKEYGGIIYIVSVNSTGDTEIGSFPSPNYTEAVEKSDSSSTLTTVVSGGLLTNLNKTILLSDKLLTVGDPFIIELEMDSTEKALLTKLNQERNYYIPKLISIDKFGNELDITDKVSKQLYYDNSSDNLWFKCNPTYDSNTFSEYAQAGKVQRYKNIRSGKLGVKFILEDIDLFNITPDVNGNFFPVLSYINSTNSYLLTFPSFDIKEGSAFKCNKINITYSIYDNTNFSLISGPITISNTNSVSMSTPRIIATSNFAIPLSTNNITIQYKITPSNDYYLYDFENYIIKDRLDLSKNALSWSLRPFWSKIDSINYCELINPERDINYRHTRNFSHTLSQDSIFSTEHLDIYNIIHNKPIICTIPAFAINWSGKFYAPTDQGGPTTNSVSVDIDVEVVAKLCKKKTDNTGTAIIIESRVITTDAQNNTLLWGASASRLTEVEASLETYQSFITNISFNEIIPEDTYLYFVLIEVDTTIYSSDPNSGEGFSYSQGSNTVTLPSLISYTYNNTTGYKIYPIIGKFGTFDGTIVPLDAQDEVVLDGVTTQAVYRYTNYTADIIEEHNTIGSFTIDNNIANCTPAISDVITTKEYNTTFCPI